MLKDGEIAEMGSLKELMQRGGEFVRFFETYEYEQKQKESKEEELSQENYLEEKQDDLWVKLLDFILFFVF